MSDGWFTMHRGWRENPIFGGEFSRADAWVWLIENACWKPTKFNARGTIIDLDRGQMCVTVRQLAEAWGWSKSTVDRFLNALRAEKMIDCDVGQPKTVLTICNYSKYQDIGSAQRDSEAVGQTTPFSGTAVGQETGQPELPVEHAEQTIISTNQPDLWDNENADGGTRPPEKRDIKEQRTIITKVRDDDESSSCAKALVAVVNNDLDEAIRCWNLAAARCKWPIPAKVTPERKKKLNARLIKYGLETWKEALRIALNSPYLIEAPPWFTFDWMTKNDQNILKVLEGNYSRVAKSAPDAKQKSTANFRRIAREAAFGHS